ncbi:PfkB family carbohydrate kinase [Biostraticola tofi]|uniref:Fructoselysine 6-kinase n=1 Tax=Biostraticola tofi TaxID=466109 RepID=A0A4R3Z114_9GAMM|nr:PfkB family carbohydrate kinase [Biostraticola tofi]TCV98746.1 fructoselysine 6-kinase [Biostraticola tofi]
MKVLGLGDNVIDRYTHTGIGYPGGNALNFSVYARLLSAEAAYLGVFGNDPAADHIQRVLAARGIDISHCLVTPGENGHASLTIEQGDRRFLGSNAGGIRQSTPMDFALNDMPWLNQFALIHTSAYSYADHLLPALGLLPSLLSYDFSDDFDLGQALLLCRWLDYGFFSCAEYSLEESRRILAAAWEAGCSLPIATRGAEGALLFNGSHWLTQAPELITPVDTLGAGDAFITAFLLAHAGGGTQAESLARGAGFAAQICLMEGAFGDGMPYFQNGL